MLNRLRDKFQRFMIGRYGMDQLGQFMVSAVLVVIVINLFVRAALPSMILNMLELAGLFAMYFRMFSKNVGQRYQENQAYLRKRFYVTEYWKKVKFYFAEGRRYRIFKCPGCSQKIRIPRGHGKVSIHCPKCGCVPVPEDQLPLKLPEVESYQPTGTGESPLAAIDEWVNTTCPVCGAPAKRETNTMPQWAGSSWYFLRYVDSHNKEELVSREKADKYLPVDMYIGGVEHAVLHLLYSRFYTKFLCDIGAIDFDEPFKKLFNQGMITGKNGIKMSKSKGNVVSPDDLVRDYGCDSLRLYELFVGPPELDAEWDDRGIEGVSRFLNRFWNLVMDNKDKDVKASKEMIKLRHKLVYDIEYRFNQFSLNTVISGFMEYNNKLIELARKEGGIDKETLKTFVILLAPFAPHIGEELWQQLGGTDSVFHAQWPECDEEAMKDDEIEVAVQINGKTRAVISISADSSREDAIAAGREAVKEKMTGNVVKEIYVPGKIINIVCK